MKTLASMLGRWEYTHGTSDKYYQIIPDPAGADNYQLSWGKRKTFNPQGTIKHVSATEAFRRILEKERGGYTQIEKFTGVAPASVHITEADLQKSRVKNKKSKQKVNQPTVIKPELSKKRGFSFMEWAENNSQK